MRNKLSFLIFSFFVCSILAASAQAPPEGRWYADQGILEIGFNGWIDLPDNDKKTTLLLSPFANYFISEDFHIGLRLTYMGSIVDNDPPASDTESTFWHFLPSIGYTLALNPKIMLDFSGNAGLMIFDLSDSSASGHFIGFSYGLVGLILTPLSENIVLGIGLAISWYSWNGTNGTQYTDSDTWVPIQFSFYW